MIPVVFTHRAGVKNVPQGYLPYAIRQAQQYNDRVILVGDQSNGYLEVEHYDYAQYYAWGAEAFQTHYVHMCTNEHSFELWNLQEYFVLRNFMEAQGLDKMFLCDSDVMLYCDVGAIMSEMSPYTLACNWAHTQWQYRWSASAHVSYWTLGTITEFCDFIWETYTTPSGLAKIKEKWDWHIASATHGGVCDMTLLWLFIQDKNVVNLTQVAGGAVFDNSINVSANWLDNEYQMHDGIKEVVWRRGQPWGYNLKSKQWVRFNALHFQGNAKRLMRDHYRGVW